MSKPRRDVEILLIEDNPGDVRLVEESLRETRVDAILRRVTDGVEASDYLRRVHPYEDAATPDLILLDLNLPRKDGRELLAEVKADPVLRRIPIVVLTSSKAEEDVLKAYELHANAYIAKPLQVDDFMHAVGSLNAFWLTTVRLPTRVEG